MAEGGNGPPVLAFGTVAQAESDSVKAAAIGRTIRVMAVSRACGRAASPVACLCGVNVGCAAKVRAAGGGRQGSERRGSPNHRDGIRPIAGARRLTSIKGDAWCEA
jgi:hypothetical protein